MRFLLVLIFVFATIGSQAQNLVPNPSFEDYTLCPWSLGGLEALAAHWFSPTNTFPSYFNSCADTIYPNLGVPRNNVGFQPARSGQAYAMIDLYSTVAAFPNFRTYAEVGLTEALEQDTTYCVEFFVSLCGDHWDMCAVANVGMFISVDSVVDSQKDTLSYGPQITSSPDTILIDTLNWMKISGTYQAQGGEKFITIGNFLPNDQTNAINTTGSLDAAYYLDDVSVMKCSQVGLSSNGLVVNQTELHLYPNPAENTLSFKSPETAVGVVIHDISGRKIIHPTTNPIDVSALPQGVFMLEVITPSKRYHHRFVK